MAGVWSIIVPKGGYTNLITNPSFETNTTGWTAVGGSIAVQASSATHGYMGLYVTATAGASDGVYYGTLALTDGVTYTFGIDIRGQSRANGYTIYFADAAGAAVGTPVIFTGDSTYFQREYVTFACTIAANYRVYVTKNNWAGTGSFSIDGACVYSSSSEITYWDGDSKNCRWTGTAHATTSVCETWARNVGVVTDLQDYNLRVLSMDGVGATSAAHHVNQYATMPGAEYIGRKVQPRYITLTNATYGTSLENLHSKRKSIIDLFKHDAVPFDQPIILRYTGANSLRPIDIECYLDQEIGAFDQQKVQKNAIRLACYDPYSYDIFGDSRILTTSSNATRRYFACKRNGSWTSITPSAVTDPGAGIRVSSIAVAGSYYRRSGPTRYKGEIPSLTYTNERIYVGGLFLNWNGTAASDYICYYDPVTAAWSAIEAGTDDAVYTIAVAPNGYIYAGGEFTQIGSVAAAKIAYWDGAAWNAMGTGFPGAGDECRAIVIGNDGLVYAGGTSAGIGGVGDANFVGCWNGAAWVAMATGVDSTVYAMTKDEAGNIYVGGLLTGNLQKWDGTAWTSLAAPDNVYALTAAPNGYIYAGMHEDVQYWNGQSWNSMSANIGTGEYVYSLDMDADGLLWVGGSFVTAGGLTVNGLACWNGYAWVHPDIKLPAGADVYAVTCNGNDIYLGYDISGTTYYSTQNIVYTYGTASNYPAIKINLSGGTSASIRYIKNEITGATIYCNYDLLAGETIYLDFSEQSRSVTSSFYGPVWRAILRGSQFSEFFLTTGFGSWAYNTISVFVYSIAGTVTSYLKTNPRHESIDGPAV